MWNHIILHAWRLLNSIWCWSSPQTEELKKHTEKQPFKMALDNWPTIMLLLEPPFDLGTKSLSTGFITLLISVLIFMYFSDRPWFSWPELLFRSSLGVLFKSVSVEPSSDLLLLYVTSHTDVETWRLSPCNYFVMYIHKSSSGNQTWVLTPACITVQIYTMLVQPLRIE